MEIDRRVHAKEFMQLLSIGREKFYKLIKTGKIQQPIHESDRDVYWYASYVKEKIEEYKPQT